MCIHCSTVRLYASDCSYCALAFYRVFITLGSCLLFLVSPSCQQTDLTVHKGEKSVLGEKSTFHDVYFLNYIDNIYIIIIDENLSKERMSNIVTCQFGLLIEFMRVMTCGLAVTSWGNPAESMYNCFHFHYQGCCRRPQRSPFFFLPQLLLFKGLLL